MIVRINEDQTVEKIVQIGEEKDERICGIKQFLPPLNSYYLQ